MSLGKVVAATNAPSTIEIQPLGALGNRHRIFVHRKPEKRLMGNKEGGE